MKCKLRIEEYRQCVLPAGAVSGSLPWRSASSHRCKARGEPHAARHGAKNTEKQRNVIINGHRKAN